MNALFIENHVISLANVTHITTGFYHPGANVFYPRIIVHWNNAPSSMLIISLETACDSSVEALGLARRILWQAVNLPK